MILRNCNLRTFSERCRGKTLVCYGIGFEFEQMLKNYAGYPWVNAIESLADNSPSKWETDFDIQGRRYQIQRPEQMFADNDVSDMVILITCSYWADIVEQLNSVKKLANAECYIYQFMFALSEREKIVIPQTEECLIPAVIHYCWFGKKELPDLYKRCIESWHRYCPDYEMREWNEDTCDVSETLFTKQAYEAGKYGFVPDYFRLKIIYEQGGIYLDTDVEVLKSLDDLRHNEAFCGMQAPGEAAFGLGFGAVSEHRVIRRLMERYQKMPFLKEDGNCDEPISSVYQTGDLQELGLTYGNRLQKVRGLTVYPTEVLSPQNVLTGECDITEHTYALHHYDGSWVSGEKLVKKRQRAEDAKKIREMFV